jgi:hypothetical protein
VAMEPSNADAAQVEMVTEAMYQRCCGPRM